MIRGARGADTTPRSSDDRQARFSRFVTSTKYLAGQTVQPFESLAHCGDSGGQIDPWGWTQSQHGLHPVQHIHHALERTPSKSGCTSIRRAAVGTTASPQLGSCGACDFPAANSTGTNHPAEEVLDFFTSSVASSGADLARRSLTAI